LYEVTAVLIDECPIIMTDPQTMREQVVRAAMAGWIAAGFKSVKEVVDEYALELSNNVYKVWGNKWDKGDFVRAHKSMIRKYAEQAFFEGMVEGGFEDEDEARDWADEEELDLIRGWITDQSGYVNDFAAAVADVNVLPKEDRPAAQSAILGRVVLWASALDTLASLGRAAAQKNKMSVWHLGVTEEHCVTCQRLDGMRRRVKWFLDRGYIPRQNGSDTLSCGGWNCDCEVVDAKTGDRIL
jgi:hypothetical protein